MQTGEDVPRQKRRVLHVVKKLSVAITVLLAALG